MVKGFVIRDLIQHPILQTGIFRIKRLLDYNPVNSVKFPVLKVIVVTFQK